MTPPEVDPHLVYERPRLSWGQRVVGGLGVTAFVLGVGVLAWQVMGGALPVVLAVALMVGAYLVQSRLRPSPVLSPTRVWIDTPGKALVLEGRGTVRVPFGSVASVSWGKHLLSDGIALDAVTLHGPDGSRVVWTVADAASGEAAARTVCSALRLAEPTTAEGPGPSHDNDDDGQPDPAPAAPEAPAEDARS